MKLKQGLALSHKEQSQVQSPAYGRSTWRLRITVRQWRWQSKTREIKYSGNNSTQIFGVAVTRHDSHNTHVNLNFSRPGLRNSVTFCIVSACPGRPIHRSRGHASRQLIKPCLENYGTARCAEPQRLPVLLISGWVVAQTLAYISTMEQRVERATAELTDLQVALARLKARITRAGSRSRGAATAMSRECAERSHSQVDVTRETAPWCMQSSQWPVAGQVILAHYNQSSIVVYAAFNKSIASWYGDALPDVPMRASLRLVGLHDIYIPLPSEAVTLTASAV